MGIVRIIPPRRRAPVAVAASTEHPPRATLRDVETDACLQIKPRKGPGVLVRAMRPVGRFAGGVRALAGGTAFIVGRPANWPLAAVPVVVLLGLTAALGSAGVWGVHAWLARSALHGLVRAALGWSLGLAAVLLGYGVALALAQPLAGFALKTLARRQEVALGGTARPEPPWLAATWRSLTVSLTALAIGLPVLAALTLISVIFPVAAVVTVPLKFLTLALLAAWDLLDYPLSLRGVPAGARLRWMWTHRAAVLGFGAATGGLLLVPGVGLLLLPFGVAGAARLVYQLDPASR